MLFNLANDARSSRDILGIVWVHGRKWYIDEALYIMIEVLVMVQPRRLYMFAFYWYSTHIFTFPTDYHPSSKHLYNKKPASHFHSIGAPRWRKDYLADRLDLSFRERCSPLRTSSRLTFSIHCSPVCGTPFCIAPDEDVPT